MPCVAIKSISFLLQKSKQQKHEIRTGIGKLWSVGQIQLTSYFCSAYNLRILFIFLDHPKRWKRRLWHENSMKFKFQCPWVKFYWNTDIIIYILPTTAFAKDSRIVWLQQRQYGLQSLNIHLPVPVQKTFANLCCRNQSQEASKNSLEVVFFSQIIDATF